MLQVFLATIFNMLGILMITFGHIAGLQNVIGLPFMFGGKFSDFTGGWYGEVGSAFERTLANQAVMPFIVEFGVIYAYSAYVRLRRSSCVNQARDPLHSLHYLPRLQFPNHAPRSALLSSSAWIASAIFCSIAARRSN